MRVANWVSRLLLLVLVTSSVAGCGRAKYEERLKASSEFYEYMQTVEANLTSPIWERSDLGLKWRLPTPFRFAMQRPELLQDEEGNTFYGEDLRHPEVLLGIELPGIIEAWQTLLPGESGEQVDSRIYVLTNHSRFVLVDGALVEEPMDFLDDLESLLGTVFNVVIPEGEADRPADNIRYGISHPVPGSPHSKYIDPKSYSVIRFVSEEPVNGQQVQAVLYEHLAGDIQSAVLIIGPKSFSSQFRQRVDLALQTFSVQPQVSSQIDKATGTSTTGGSSGF